MLYSVASFVGSGWAAYWGFRRRGFSEYSNLNVPSPPEQAEQRALEAQQRAQSRGGGQGSIIPLLVWGFIIFFIILPALFGRGGRGRRYRGRRRGIGPVIIWGGPWGGGSGWGGGGGCSWGGGGGGGGFGGFSGGGGSFGGGGASGSW